MPTYTPPSTASPSHRVFASFINAFDAFDVDGMLSYLDSTATFTLLPKAMGVPPMSKKHLGPYFKTQIVPAFDTMEVTVHEVIESENTIVAHAQSDSTSKQGTPWHNEYIFIFKFTDGPNPKITSWTEFGNSAFVAGFMAEEAKKSARTASL